MSKDLTGYLEEESKGYTTREAIDEAKRCLKCPRPKCKEGCPISNDIPEFMTQLAMGNIGSALEIINKKSNLPAVCGRVCPHELQCEGHCILNSKGTPVRVGKIERFLADFDFEMDLTRQDIPQKNRGQVAVIGSGPAGLTIAGDLSKAGFNVTVYEASSEPGGVLMYGIPAFRLPKDVVRREIDRIKALGINFVTNCMAGVDITVDSLFDKGFDAIFIGTGTARALELDIPGKELHGIIQSSYLLHMISLFNSGQIDREEVPAHEDDTSVVIGGGNVAMDAARSLKRMGINNVKIVYYRKRENLAALKAEYEAAVEDGVEFLYETQSLEFIGKDGTVAGVLVDTPNGQQTLLASKVFLAVGSRPANRIVSTAKGIDVDERGYVISVDKPYGMTTRKGVFAGGDVVHKPATVVLAMKEAKKVAEGIASYIDAVKLLNL